MPRKYMKFHYSRSFFPHFFLRMIIPMTLK
nr:MAG TPA: hypothetical protein [Caudoviricetes sp.]